MLKDLGSEQREMRERMNRQTNNTVKKKEKTVATDTQQQIVENAAPDDINSMRKRIIALESENQELKAEINRLRQQKTVYVEREQSAGETRRQQQHNYLKYSNARRW